MASFAALASAVLVVILAAVLAAWKARPGYGPVPGPIPHFVVCGTLIHETKDCDPALPQRLRPTFVQAVADQAKEYASSGRRPLLIHVGLNAFYPDVLVYAYLFDLSPKVPYRIVLVEPDDQWNEQIDFQVKRFSLRERAEEVQVFNSALAGECKADPIFYRLNRKLWDDYDLNNTFDKEGFGSSSMHRFWFEQGLKNLLDTRGKGVEIANVSEYIDEVKVSCLDPAALMRKANAEVSDLVMLMVDAELEDCPIVKALLELGARPAYIFFEASMHNRSENWDLFNRIMPEYGYSMGKQCDTAKCPAKGSHNVVALRERRWR